MQNDGAGVLVVDDDVDIATNMKDILCSMGYRVDVAHDGASALAMTSRCRYDVALLDFKMPDMNGATLYREIKSVQPSITAIMVTAQADSDGLARAHDAENWRVVRKPVDVAKLITLIAKATKQPKGGLHCVPAELSGRLDRDSSQH